MPSTIPTIPTTTTTTTLSLLEQILYNLQVKNPSLLEEEEEEEEDSINREFISEICDSGSASQDKIKSWIKGLYEMEKGRNDTIVNKSSCPGMKKLLVNGYVHILFNNIYWVY